MIIILSWIEILSMYQKKISVDDLVCEANRIWEEYGPIKVDAENSVAVQKLIDAVIADHPDFAQVHMIVIRYIVQMKLYSPVAVRKYANHIIDHPWKTFEDMIDAQVLYVKHLYKLVCKFKTPRVRAIGEEVRGILLADAKKYEAMSADLAERIKSEEEALEERMRNETRAYFEQHKTDACAIPIRAIIDRPVIIEYDAPANTRSRLAAKLVARRVVQEPEAPLNGLTAQDLLQ